MNGLPVAVVSTKRWICNDIKHDPEELMYFSDWQFHVNGVFDSMEKAWKHVEKLYDMFLKDALAFKWTINMVHIFDASSLIDEVDIEYTDDKGQQCVTILDIYRTRVV